MQRIKTPRVIVIDESGRHYAKRTVLELAQAVRNLDLPGVFSFQIGVRELEQISRLPVLIGIRHQVHEAGLQGKLRRSEEHTSELQSLRHLVCRLLLEKKEV